MLVATGRRPKTDGLGLETADIALGAGGEASTAHYLIREVLYGMLAMDSFYLQ